MGNAKREAAAVARGHPVEGEGETPSEEGEEEEKGEEGEEEE